jgi:hypothetical protein
LIQKARFSNMIAFLLLALIAACDDDAPPPGEIHVRVRSEALVVGSLARVELRVTDSSGEEISNTELARARVGWSGTVTGIASDRALTIMAVGETARDLEIARAHVAGVRLVAGKTTDVVLHLVEHSDGTEWNRPPVIEGIAVSPMVADAGEVVSILANVRDDDRGDEPEISWEVAGGTLSGGDGTSPTWIAPARAGGYEATLRAIDSSGAVEVLSITLEAQTNPNLDEGLAVEFETSPQIIGIETSPEEIGPGDTLVLEATVYDRDSDAELAYRWSEVGDSCDGTFVATDEASTSWTSPIELALGTSCAFDLLASDGDIEDETDGFRVGARRELTLDCVHPYPIDMQEVGTLRIGPSATPAMDGKIYLIGETQRIEELTDTYTYTTSVWVYDIDSDSFEELEDAMPFGVGQLRRSSIGVASNGKVYIEPSLGPEYNAGYGTRGCLFEFDPATETTRETTACFPEVRWAVRLAAAPDGRIFTFAGLHDVEGEELPEEDRNMDDIWVYDPSDESFTLVMEGLLMSGDTIGESLLGADGLIYLFGATQIATFDPATGSVEMLGEHGLLSINDVWLAEDGLFHGFCIPAGGSEWTGGFVLDPSDLTVEISTYESPVFSSLNGAISLDVQAGHLYSFGGERMIDGTIQYVSTVQRAQCLP